MMNLNVDYRSLAYRQEGFDWFYKAMCESGDVSPDLACERWIADDAEWDFEKRCVLALQHGATYSGPTESILADKFPRMTCDIEGITKFYQKNKERLIFSDDCKYRRMVYEKFLASVGESIKPFGTLGGFITSCFQGEDKKANYLRLQEKCDQWFHWGRMGHWCFAEAIFRIADAPIEAPTMEFGKNGKSHTAGWAFCMGRDDLLVDDYVWTKENVAYLEDSAASYLKRFKAMFPQLIRADFFTLETACCNYKRGHKGSRYQLCYIDEQHNDIIEMMDLWPEYRWLWKKYLEARQVVFPASLLFENNRNDPRNTATRAHSKSWNVSLKDYGRMPRVEAYINGQPQLWFEPFSVELAQRSCCFPRRLPLPPFEAIRYHSQKKELNM